MPAKHSPAFRLVVALGLGLSLTACGPIAFQDTIKFAEPERKAEPKLEAAPAPDPEPAPERKPSRARISGDQIVIDEMIQFEYDSAEILPVSHGILDDVVKVMKDNPQIEQVDIIGHTSSEGSLKHNNKLSTDRAASVKQYLIDHGIDTGRLTSQGKGPSDPIAENDTEEGRIKNRRVEFKIVKMGAADGAAKSGGARARPGGN
jgi:outer membrane protein OmpA-like peptidoglycan-associated protein